MTDSTKIPISDPKLRELAAVLHERYSLAARIARATWPATETSPEAMVAACATVFIEINRQMSHADAATLAPARTTLPAVAPVGVEAPPPCPECGKPMRDQRATKRGNQPDYKCGPGCDGALWLDRKRAAR